MRGADQAGGAASWANGPVTLYTGDAQQVLASLPTASVDCIVTSPPYWGLRDYGTGGWDGGRGDCPHRDAPTAAVARRTGQLCRCPTCGAVWVDQQHGLEHSLTGYVDRLVTVFTEAHRVLHPTGTLWLNLGDSYAGNGPLTAAPHGPGSGVGGKYRNRKWHIGTVPGIPAKNLLGVPWRVAFALQSTGLWWLRNAIVWAKTNPMPESVQDRLSCTHEMIFLLTPNPRYHFDLDAIRVPRKHPTALDRGTIIGGVGKGPRNAVGSGTRRYGRNTYSTPKTTNPDPVPLASRPHDNRHPAGKNPGDVWHLPTRPLKDAHFAAFPIDIPLRCIAAGCRPDGTVLDPFSGAATTGLAALQLDRRYIGIDLNPDYTTIARRRLSPSDQDRAEPPGTPSDVGPTAGLPSTSSRSGTSGGRRDHRLDAFTPPRVDRRPQPAPPENTGRGATAPPAHLGRDAERTTDPCSPYPHPAPKSVPADAADHRRSADHDASPQRGPSDAAGQR